MVAITNVFFLQKQNWDMVPFDGLEINERSILYYESVIHTGSDNAAVLTDSNLSLGVNVRVDFRIINYNDGSSSVITANTATTVTGVLTGGLDNNWDTDDSGAIVIDISAGAQIRYQKFTDNNGRVTIDPNGIYEVDGVDGSHTFDVEIVDISDDTVSASFTMTV